jgi:DNA invertase Pin-like site-specific DNA recombinase
MAIFGSQTLAAQYLRVSTEGQRYSIDHQRDCIRRYAEQNGFSIIQTYVDQARSGLRLDNRPGLKQLLADVTGRDVRYHAILVYDISRWGRFQDVDEAGHYEFICKQCGTPVRYCAEPFGNDDTAAATIMKALKRTMAAEYSRELGNRCFAGQRRIAQIGFRVGGAAPYAYRRILVTPDRRVKQQLVRGERKGIATDRVLLVPGPAEEVATVQQIYRMLIERKMSYCEIAKELNRQGIKRPSSKPWTHHQVRSILTSPSYEGTMVYGRTSQRLQTSQTKIPPQQWVVFPQAFDSIVDDETYVAAQRELAGRTTHKGDEQMLEELRAILRSRGSLTAKLIRSTKGCAPPSSYRNRFGSLEKAYGLVGYRMSLSQNIETRERIRRAYSGLLQKLKELFLDTLVIEGGRNSFRRSLRFGTDVVIPVRACTSFRTKLGRTRWRIRTNPTDQHRLALLLLMGSTNETVSKVVLLPPMSLPRTIDVSGESRLLRICQSVSPISTLFGIVSEMRSTNLTSGDSEAHSARFLRSVVARETSFQPEE